MNDNEPAQHVTGLVNFSEARKVLHSDRAGTPGPRPHRRYGLSQSLGLLTPRS
jgi:hypothetical protein